MNNDIKFLDSYISKEIAKNSNVSFSGLFKRLRTKCPLIGEIIVLNHIARRMGREGIVLTGGMAKNGAKYCEGYKEMHNEKRSVVSDILKKNLEEFKLSGKQRVEHIKRNTYKGTLKIS